MTFFASWVLHSSWHSVSADLMILSPWAQLHFAVCEKMQGHFCFLAFSSLLICLWINGSLKTPNNFIEKGVPPCLEEFHFQGTAFQWLSAENWSISWCSKSHFRAAKIEERIASLLTFKKLHQCETLKSCIQAEALANPKEKEQNKLRTQTKLKEKKKPYSWALRRWRWDGIFSLRLSQLKWWAKDCSAKCNEASHFHLHRS